MQLIMLSGISGVHEHDKNVERISTTATNFHSICSRFKNHVSVHLTKSFVIKVSLASWQIGHKTQALTESINTQDYNISFTSKQYYQYLIRPL